MRAFLLACLAMVIVGVGGYFVLSVVQEPSGVAYSTNGARIDPKWSWRSVFRRDHQSGPATKTAMSGPQAPSELAEECELYSRWEWVFVDFRDPQGEPRTCSASQ